MRIIIFTILCGLLINSFGDGNAQTRIDSIYNRMTTESRLRLLFADTLTRPSIVQPTAKANTATPRAVTMPQTPKSTRLILLTENKQAAQSISRYPAPSVQMLQNIADSGFVASYCIHLLNLHQNKDYQGICIRMQDRAMAYFIDPGEQNQVITYQLVDFPSKLNRQINSTPSVNSTIFRFSKEVQQPPVEDKSLEEILSERNLFANSNVESHIQQIKRAVEQKTIDPSLLENRIKELISLELPRTENTESMSKSQDYWRYEFYKKSIVFISRKFDALTDLSNTEIGLCNNQTAKQHNLLEFLKRYTDNVVPSHPSVLANAALMKYFVVAAQTTEEILEAATAIKEIKRTFDNQIILFYNGKWNEELFKDSIMLQFNTILMGEGPANLIFDLQTQALFGGIEVKPTTRLSKNLKDNGFSPVAVTKTRLGYAPEENSGMDAHVLNQIDAIMAEMIRLKAAPGGQVLVVHNGYVAYNKAFGSDMYSKGTPIQPETLYDLASVTKVMGTTPLIMKLYDDHSIDNSTRLGDVIPVAQNSNKADVTIEELLLHQAGLPAFIPFYLHALDSASIHKPLYSKRFSNEYPIRIENRLYMLASAKYKASVFQPRYDSLFCIRVAENMYMNSNFKTEMLQKIYNEPLRKKDYRYSDLSLYLAQQVIEQKYRKPENLLFDQYFSQPLGANRLTFLPLDKFNPQEIAPTEDDQSFRHELLRGYVHDQGAAMMGGVAGHAGLFSNSNDLAKMAQMMLNKGTYGGKQYITPQTIELFTRQQIETSRRGLGFDKPDADKTKSQPCSKQATLSSYGHSGFTGTFIWIDPDKSLIYIFLSNRVHPNAYNNKLINMGFRIRVQDVIYNALTE